MAYSSKYQYGTSPRKIAPEYRPIKKNTSDQRKTANKQSTVRKKQTNTAKKKNINLAQKAKLKKERMMKMKVIAMVLCLFAVLFVISYRSSLISENFAQIKNLKKELESLEKENQQLNVGIESTLNLNNIEKIAEEKLGMQKLKSDQIVYVNLPKQDYIQPSSEQIRVDKNENFIQKLINKIF